MPRNSQGLSALFRMVFTLLLLTVAVASVSAQAASESVPESVTPLASSPYPLLAELRLTKFAKIVPLAHNADDYLRRASHFAQIGDYKRAVEEVTKALADRPQFAPALKFRAEMYLRMAKAADRVARYTEQIVQTTDERAMAQLIAERAFAQFNRGEYERAVSDFDDALRLVPEWRTLYLGRGLAQMARGAWEDADNDFRKAWSSTK